MKSHFQSYPCPLQINSFWNLGFLLGITIILQIITGIFLGLQWSSRTLSIFGAISTSIPGAIQSLLTLLHSPAHLHLWDLRYNNLSPYKNRIIFIRK